MISFEENVDRTKEMDPFTRPATTIFSNHTFFLLVILVVIHKRGHFFYDFLSLVYGRSFSNIDEGIAF